MKRNAAKEEAEAVAVNTPTIPKTITDVSAGSTSDPVKESGGFKDSLQDQTKNNTCFISNDTTGQESSDELKEADLDTKSKREGFWRRWTARRKLKACLPRKSKQSRWAHSGCAAGGAGCGDGGGGCGGGDGAAAGSFVEPNPGIRRQRVGISQPPPPPPPPTL